MNICSALRQPSVLGQNCVMTKIPMSLYERILLQPLTKACIWNREGIIWCQRGFQQTVASTRAIEEMGSISCCHNTPRLIGGFLVLPSNILRASNAFSCWRYGNKSTDGAWKRLQFFEQEHDGNLTEERDQWKGVNWPPSVCTGSALGDYFELVVKVTMKSTPPSCIAGESARDDVFGEGFLRKSTKILIITKRGI